MTLYGRPLRFKFEKFKFHNHRLPEKYESKSTKILKRAEREEIRIIGSFRNKLEKYIEAKSN